MRYNAVHIANYFLNKAFSEGDVITPMKLLKLVYIAHGWNLAVNEQPLIAEQVEAWKYGPVIRSVYDQYKIYGRNPIRQIIGFVPTDIDPKTKAVLDKVWDVYKKYDGLQLSSLTHKIGSPWDIAFNQNHHDTIAENLIRDHYNGK